MKLCSKCLTRKPLSDFRPHSTKCKQCISERDREYTAAHREQARERTQEWREKNPDRTKENLKQYYQQNRERELKKSKIRYKKNVAANRLRSKLWRKNNRGKVAAQTAKRRADRKQATPMWANIQQISSLYEQAVTLSNETGIAYQVDHIVPLNSKVVCGLHCEDNLQVITAEENNSKKNKLIEELL